MSWHVSSKGLCPSAPDTWVPAFHSVTKRNPSGQRAAALAVSRGSPIIIFAARALSLAGADSKAVALLEELSKRRPADIVLQTMELPTARGVAELHRGRPNEATRMLESVHVYGTLRTVVVTTPAALAAQFDPLYARGEAYLKAGKNREAAEQFEQMLKQRMLWPVDPLLTLAHLGLGRAYAAAGSAGSVDQGRTAYQDFFALVKNADADLPVLAQARAEYAKLK